MFLIGGNIRTILMSCFSNMKIYTRECCSLINIYVSKFPSMIILLILINFFDDVLMLVRGKRCCLGDFP